MIIIHFSKGSRWTLQRTSGRYKSQFFTCEMVTVCIPSFWSIFLTPPAVLDTSASPVESQRICGHLYKCSFRRHWPSGWLAIRLVSTLERDAMGDTNMLSSRTSQCEKKIWAHGVGVQGLKMSIFLQCGPRYQPAGNLLGCSNKTKQTS